MKINLKLNFLFCFLLLTFIASAQVDPVSAINIGAGIGKSIFGSVKDKKKTKIIQNSIFKIEINRTKISILRVNEDKIISKAKGHIIRIQNQLDEYYKKYKDNQHIDMPNYFDGISVLNSIDGDWPTEYYDKEFKEYRNYERTLIQKEKAAKDSILTALRVEQKRIADSLTVERKRYDDSLAYVQRIEGYHFINKEYSLLKEKPSDKSKTIGKIFLGSYIKLLGYSDNSQYLKISMQGIEGFVPKADLVDSIDKINIPFADHVTYKSRQYYKYEPNYEYVSEQEMYSSSASSSSSTKTIKTTKASNKKQSYSQAIRYIRGSRGGCYYLTSSGNKVYVDRSYCR